MSRDTERSLVLIKPDAVIRRQVGVEILKALKSLEGVEILAFKEAIVSQDLAKKHYGEHEEKSFFPWLMDMITAPFGICALVLEGGRGLVGKIRDLIGPTYVEKAREENKHCLRGRYGIIKGINIAHASDSPESGTRETDLWIKELGLKLDAKAAVVAVNDYIKKHDGAHANHSKKIQKVAMKIRKEVQSLKDLIQAETDESKESVEAFLKIILSAFP